MGLLDTLKKLIRPYDEEEEEEEEEREQAETPAPAAAPVRREPGPVEEAAPAPEPRPDFRRQVVVLRPRHYIDASEIADRLRERRPVVVNMEDLPKAELCRLADFLAGGVYMIGGSLRKVGDNTYLLTPPGVEPMMREVDGML